MLEQQNGTASVHSPVAAWQMRIDHLATKAIISGVGADTIKELSALSDESEQAGFAEFAAAAGSLAVQLKSAGGDVTKELLKSELPGLHKAMELSRGAPDVPSSAYESLSEDPELVGDFLVEAREHLSQIEAQTLALEKDPGAMDVVHAVFRAFHTIKGLAGFLGFRVMQQVSHEVETLLDLARNEKIHMDSAVVDVVLESGDFVLNDLSLIERMLNGEGPLLPSSNGELIAKIRRLSVSRAKDVAEPAVPSGAEVAATVEDIERSVGPEMPSSLENMQQPAMGRETLSATAFDDVRSVPKDGASLETPQRLIPPAACERKPEQIRTNEPMKSVEAGSVRVETAKLDHLMDMVGELVIAQSLIQHSPVLASATDSRLVGDLSQLARVTAEVQRATMSMRMVPVGQLFQKIERVIRDLSRKAGKQVVLETSGTDTELDKTVAEELSDPLLHMVRNSVDHGIETPEERSMTGKPPVARIRLAAYHQGGQVVIQISDDGRGLNAQRIRSKAEEKNLIAADETLTETEVFQLIFAPGFSTAEKITDVSGRGVGMDVVKRNVEKLRGRIETQSLTGQGTSFLLKLPLTLAIIDGLVVSVATNQYIIPLSTVREIFHPLADTLFTVKGRDEMVLIREKLLPIVRLNQRLGIKARAIVPSDGLLVIIESEGKLFCLLVDDLVGKQEVVIKGLGEVFVDATGFSGCAVLGNGQVGLILDTDGIYRGRRR